MNEMCVYVMKYFYEYNAILIKMQASVKMNVGPIIFRGIILA